MKTQSPPARSLVSRLVDVLGLSVDLDLRENEPPRRAGDLAAWEARAHELATCAELMQVGGVPADGHNLNFIAPGERLFFVLRGGALVEPGEVTGRWLPREMAVSFRPARGTGHGVTSVPLDWGTVAITNLRVAFQGAAHARHWLYSEFVGALHDHDDPITFFHVASEEHTAGVLYPSDVAESFRLRLAVALAWADDNPRPFEHALKAELEAHMARCPLEA